MDDPGAGRLTQAWREIGVRRKANFNPDEPRDWRGRWTSGGDSPASQDRDSEDVAVVEDGAGIEFVSDRLTPVAEKKTRFVAAHYADALAAARALQVPVENILGVAAYESEWGGSRFALSGHNYFGLHYPAPFDIGAINAKDSHVKMAVFANFGDSLRSFVREAAPYVQGVSNPEAFVTALQNGRKFGTHVTTGTKVSDYVAHVASTILGLRPTINHYIHHQRK